jgi:signal transduction histidine kinase/ActR/RegA family two-component response regulator
VLHDLFGSELWKPALDKYAQATGLSVELFDAKRRLVLNSPYSTPLLALFREYGFEPGLFADCVRRCLIPSSDRPAVVVTESHGLTVVGTSLLLEGKIVGAAVAGYALDRFTQVPAIQRWAESAGVPFEKLWNIARALTPLPEGRLKLHGELLQVLGDALLRANYRTWQYEEAAEQLEAASAAKDEFMAVLSHELRTPLAPIVGWASVLKKSQNMDQVHRAAEVIERNAMMQSLMIEDLLDVSRIEHGKVKLDIEPLELQALVRAAMETSAHGALSKAIRMESSDEGERLFVDGDLGRLQQVFRNILSNALKFTPPGGTIHVVQRREGDHAVVQILDTGAGIESDFLPYVFDIFRQQEQGTRREHQGLGIGLALVKKLTELHKGSVEIASGGRGHGTQVTVRLPLSTTADRPEPDSTQAVAEPTASILAGLSILVVEDTEDARESLRAMLELAGVVVSVARDGREALAVMRGVPPDIVLCDLRMPRLDGFEFMRALMHDPDVAHPPVIALSGLVSERDRQHTREAGFEAHLKKPVDMRAIIAAVSTALAHRQAS